MNEFLASNEWQWRLLRTIARGHIPPPLGTLDAGGTEHVKELGSGIQGQPLEALAHGIEDGLAGGGHVVANLLLLFEHVALWRVDAKIRAKVCRVLNLAEFGHLGFVDHGLNLLPRPNTLNGGAGVVRIIQKGAFSSEVKWCADFSNTPLLTCGFIAF